MVKISLIYEGDLRVTARHEPSQKNLITDAPVDNHGRGESFSPTDLLATGLASCMATIMGIKAAKQNVSLQGMTLTVEKEMVEGPRRIGSLTTVVHAPKNIPLSVQEELKNAAVTCPVYLSLNPEIKKPVTFLWDL